MGVLTELREYKEELERLHTMTPEERAAYEIAKTKAYGRKCIAELDSNNELEQHTSNNELEQHTIEIIQGQIADAEKKCRTIKQGNTSGHQRKRTIFGPRK